MVGTANTPGMKTFNKNQTPRNGKSTGRIQPSSYARSIVISTRYNVTYSECKFSVTMLACWNLILILDAKQGSTIHVMLLVNTDHNSQYVMDMEA